MDKMIEVDGRYGAGFCTRVRVHDVTDKGGWITRRVYRDAMNRLGLSSDGDHVLRVLGEKRGFTITVEPHFYEGITPDYYAIIQ